MNEQAQAGRTVPSRFLDYLPKISPTSWAYDGLHHQLIGEHLDAVTRGEIDRLAIFMPPRHGKTETVTIRYPVYRLEKDLTTRCLITGYNERIARKFSRRARNLAKTRFSLSDDKTGVDEWETASGGGVVARGVGTPPTGFGFNIILVDDPIKSRAEAESQTYRDNVWDWFTDDLYTRREPGAAIILTLTRWHHDDLAARAIASEPGRWTILKLPAIAEENDPIGRRPGEALWPERFDEKELERIKTVQTKQDGSYSFEALYQQNPTPREGAFFKVSKIDTVPAIPTGLRTCRAWDLAGTKDGDYTVGVKLGVDHMANFYVLDVIRGQWLTDERDAIMKQAAALDGKDCLIHIPQDPGQAGIDQVLRLTKMLAGYRIRSDRPTGSKEIRADGAASQVNVGNVKMILAPKWNSAFLEELRTFPLGTNDDQVDALADAVTALTGPSKIGAASY